MSRLSRIKAFAFHLAPRVVQNKIRTYSENKKVAHWQECFKTKISKDEVDELFTRLALNSDVMIHSSLPDIGNIRLKHITDNLKKYVLDTGHTILCPSIPVKGSTLDYLKSMKVFDVRTAPNAMGAISNYYEHQEGAKRSMSPTHSVVAIGKRTDYYLDEHHFDETPFTEKSPYFKLILNNGKILMLGASLKNFTFFHVLEDIMGEGFYPINVYAPRKFRIVIINELGISQSRSFRAHSHKNSWRLDGAKLLGEVITLPSTKTINLGCGRVLLLDAKDVSLCLLRSIKEGITLYGHRRVSECCQQKADYWINYIEGL